MEERSISVKELLSMTADEIKAIRVPVSLALEICRPLDQAVRNIEACIQALDDQPKEGDENVMEH